jgi:hypothetical protein
MNTQQAGPAKTERVDATGTQRRIQAMVANGRPLAEIARLLGREPGPVSRILTQATVNEETAQAVSGLYRRIGDRIPQPQTPAERRQIAAARKLAARRAWPPSLAWDIDQIDDPGGAPVGGWKGWQPRSLRGSSGWAAVAEDAEFLAREEGPTDKQIAERLGMSPNALQRVLSLVRKTSADRAPEPEAEAG